jgi:hypothetical protein
MTKRERKRERERQVLTSHDHGPNIDTKHHFILINTKLFIDTTLPLRGKGITKKITAKKHDAIETIITFFMTIVTMSMMSTAGFLRESEHSYTSSDGEGFDVFLDWIRFTI